MISFKLDYIEGQSEQGQVTSIVVRDRANVLTIGNQHAPIITVLDHGVIQLYNGDKLIKAVDYAEGFLSCKHNLCKINLLK